MLPYSEVPGESQRERLPAEELYKGIGGLNSRQVFTSLPEVELADCTELAGQCEHMYCLGIITRQVCCALGSGLL